MSLTLSTVLVAATVTLPSCSWDKPGADPYMGSMEAAVDRYRDIPIEVRERLKARMRTRAYDDVAAITRDRIEGKRSYSNLRDMHFGNGRICRAVTRTKWLPDATERGLVYCEGEHCLIVPTVCRNVSRVTPDTPLDFETAAGPPEEIPQVLGGQRFVDDPEPLVMRRLQLDPPPGSPEPPPLPEIVPDLGPPPPTGPPNEPFPPFTPPPPPPVPEPSTWLMMAAGLALVARVAQRRRAGRAVAAAPPAQGAARLR